MSTANDALATSELVEQLVRHPHTHINEPRAKKSIDLSTSLYTKINAAAPQSTISPISSLPVELVARIFVLTDYRSPVELLTLTRVCEYWQAVAIGTAQLWTRIPYNCRFSQVEEHLERSKGLPLNVTVSLRLPEEKLLGYKKPTYVLRHLERIQSLAVTLSTWRSFKMWPGGLRYNAINKLCRKPAPNLRYLELIWDSDKLERASARSTSRMFPGANLHHLVLHRVGISWDSHLLSQGLTYLHLSDLPRYELFTRQEIRDVLGRMPGLQHLYLDSALSALGESADLPKLSPVHLSLLKKLTVRDRVDSLLDFFTLITFPGTLDVLQVLSLRSGQNHLAATNAIVEKVQDVCANWGEFWAHDVQTMIVTTKRARSLEAGRAIFQGITGAGVEKLWIELPWACQNPVIVEHTSSVLFRSGFYRISFMSWSCPDDACWELMYSAFRECASLEELIVRHWQVTSLARCLADPNLREVVQRLDKIVIEGVEILTNEEGVDADKGAKGLDMLMDVLASRREYGQQIREITLRKCVVPPETYQRLRDTVGKVEILEEDHRSTLPWHYRR